MIRKWMGSSAGASLRMNEIHYPRMGNQTESTRRRLRENEFCVVYPKELLSVKAQH
jgi:hypothetical protein